MLSEINRHVKKIGQPPGTPSYTGNKKLVEPQITLITYSEHDFHEVTSRNLDECLIAKPEAGITWLHLDGLNDISLVEKITKHYNLHPLTVEDILNVEQRPKSEEFENYLFITLKVLNWKQKTHTFTAEQLSLVLGKDFVLSFQERPSSLFDSIRERLHSQSTQRLRQHSSDYLFYRLLDTVIDQYFVVLEGQGEQIEKIEELIIASPTPQNSRSLYRLKRQMLSLRKIIWPMREVVSHLLQAEEPFISSFTRVYLRDVYDHTVQAIDTIETFRDMLAGLLDVYLSSISNRMNEVMKVLTIIATIFIPITFIASIYGMNFKYMPELDWKWGYPIALLSMVVVTVIMLIYFRRKKWI